MDDADRADERIDLIIAEGRYQASRAPAQKARGRCHFCDEPTAMPLLFCNADCSQDFEAEEDALKRCGRR